MDGSRRTGSAWAHQARRHSLVDTRRASPVEGNHTNGWGCGRGADATGSSCARFLRLMATAQRPYPQPTIECTQRRGLCVGVWMPLVWDCVLSPCLPWITVCLPPFLWVHLVSGGGCAHARSHCCACARRVRVVCDGGPAPGARGTVAVVIGMPAAGALLICHRWVPPRRLIGCDTGCRCSTGTAHDW